METLQINSPRLQKDFDALAQIGTTGNGGVHRPTFSENHLAARAWFMRRRDRADDISMMVKEILEASWAGGFLRDRKSVV